MEYPAVVSTKPRWIFRETSHSQISRITSVGMAMMKLLAATLLASAGAFHVTQGPRLAAHRASAVKMDDIPMVRTSTVIPTERPDFTCSFEIPAKGIAEYGTVNMAFKPLLVESELVVVKYELPFGLNAAPNGRVVSVNKDGPGGEKEGDILRFTLKWNDREPSMFDVCKCMERQLANSFDQVISALVSNDGTYADEIVLIFERPVSSE
jgi:hypothetical protein